ncbi:MAG TPA: hypothetical protein VIJ95_03890 [Hanamia sp.]
MKKIIFLQVVFFAMLTSIFSIQPCRAQFLKRLKNKITQTASDHVTNDAGNTTNKTIDKAEHPNASNGSNNSNNQSSSSNNNSTDSKSVSSSSNSSSAVPTIATYKNYDFVPGDSIIFESQFADEQVGEIPSQFILSHGQIDIEQDDGVNVMHFNKGPRDEFMPRMTTASYMPDQFTIEFDFKNENFGIDHIQVAFSSDNYYGGGTSGILPEILFYGGNSAWSLGGVNYPDALHVDYKDPMQWHHVAIAVNKNQGKIY